MLLYCCTVAGWMEKWERATKHSWRLRMLAVSLLRAQAARAVGVLVDWAWAQGAGSHAEAATALARLQTTWDRPGLCLQPSLHTLCRPSGATVSSADERYKQMGHTHLLASCCRHRLNAGDMAAATAGMQCNATQRLLRTRSWHQSTCCVPGDCYHAWCAAAEHMSPPCLISRAGLH